MIKTTFTGIMIMRIFVDVDDPLSSSSILCFGVLTSPHRYNCRRPLLGLADQRLPHTTQLAELVIINDMALPAVPNSTHSPSKTTVTVAPFSLEVVHAPRKGTAATKQSCVSEDR